MTECNAESDPAVAESARSVDERLRLAAESAHFGTYEHDLSTGTTYWSREIGIIAGVPDEHDVSLERAFEVVHPDDRERVRQLTAASLDPLGTGEFDSEHRLLRPDGSVCWVFARGRTTFVGDGAQRRPVRATGIILDITERKRIEEILREREDALRQSEQRFARFMEHLPGLAWIKDAQGRYVYANEAAERAFRTPRRELYGRTDEELFPPHTAAQFRDNDWRALASGSAIQTVETLEHDDGVLRHSLVSKFPITGSEDGAALVGGIAIDVTERMEAESALRETEERFRILADSSPVLIWVNGLDGCEFVNCTYRDFLGVSDADVRGYDWAQFVHPDDREAYVSGYLRAIEKRAVLEAEFRFRRHDGQYRWMRSVGRPRYGPAGQFLGYVGSTFDITERKEAEDTLRIRALQQQAVVKIGALALGEQDLQKLFDYATATVAETLGVEFTKILELLPTGERLLLRAGVGWKEGLLGHATVDASVHSQAGYTLLSDAPVIVTDLRSEQRFRGPALLLEHGVASGMSCIIRDPDRVPWGVLGVHSTRRLTFTADDVSFIAAVANSLGNAIGRRRSEEALKEADRRKDEFLATLAHELRNPLAPLSNGLEVLKLAQADAPAFEQARAMMERQLHQMVRLIDDLLDISRISRGKINLRRQRASLWTVIQQAVETSRPAVEQGRHQLTISAPPEPMYVDADPTRLGQVFANLLNNAAKFTPSGGRIWLTVARRNREAVITVRDNGVGIPADLLPRIFDMFTQVDRSPEHAQGGLGIGLSLVKALVEMHGGSIDVDSTGESMGSTFVVRLPLAPPPLPETASATEPARAAASHRILVVDDNQDAALSLAMLLNIMGNDTATAHDGLAAVDAAAAFRPDVILLDIGMPKLNGYDAARRIREQHGDGVVLVALTGWGQEEDRRRSQEAGFNFHLVKPVELAELEKLLTRIGFTPY